jgi:hypothetical protein
MDLFSFILLFHNVNTFQNITLPSTTFDIDNNFWQLKEKLKK